MEMNDTIRQAMADLNGMDENARAAAITTLAEHQYTPALESIIEIAADTDPGTRFIAVKAMGQFADASAIDVLLQLLRGDDIFTRAAVAGALIRIGAPAVDGLIEALQDADKAVRRAAAKALGKISESGQNEDALKGLSIALLDVDDGVRRFAAEALGRMNADHMVPELAEKLYDDNARVRIAAFKALAHIKTPEAQDAVHKWARE